MARSDARKKLLDELPSPEEMAATISNLKLMDDAAVALMSAACLDHALEILLKADFRTLSNDEEKRIFDGSQNGVLGTFSAKIRIAYALGWLTDEVYNDLLIINDIRNAFAHSLHKDVYFTNDYIVNDCRKLRSLKAFDKIPNPEQHPVPIHLFIETVQYTYTTFKTIADKKREAMDAYQRTYDLALRAERSAAAPSPSPRKPQRPSRRNRPTLK